MVSKQNRIYSHVVGYLLCYNWHHIQKASPKHQSTCQLMISTKRMGLWFECGLGCGSVGKNVGESAKVRVSVGEGVRVWARV